MYVSEAVGIYLDQRAADGFSPSTVNNDRRCLTRFLRVAGDMRVTELTRQKFDAFMAIEASRGLAAGTLNGYQSAMSAFASWCRESGYMDLLQNPVPKRYRKDPPKKKNYVPITDFPRLLDAAEQQHWRDRAFIAAGLYLMLRQSELCALKVGDVDLNLGEIDTLIFKTYEQDTMPISEELDRELRIYLTKYAEECGTLESDWYLFPALTQAGFHEWTLAPTRRISKPEDITRRCLTAIGFSDTRMGIHVLRRSSARGLYEELLDQGYDGAIRRVQAFLHHASVTMTERYLGLELDKEMRNKETRGLPMFPSLSAANVVPIRDREASHG